MPTRDAKKRASYRNTSYWMIERMEKFDRMVRQEIADTQVEHWTKEQIEARWEGGRA